MGQPTSLHCGAGGGGGIRQGTMQPVQLWHCYQSPPPLFTSELGPSGTDSQVGGLCTFYDPVGPSNGLSCEAGIFSCYCPPPHRCFQSEAVRLYFPTLGPWVERTVSLPGCSSWFICTQMWDHPACKPLPCLVHQSLPCQESSPPCCPTPPLLPVWMSVSSLTPWLSDFHTVWFCQFWLFFVFKFVVVLVLVMRGGTVCLPMPPSWPEVFEKYHIKGKLHNEIIVW